MGKTVDSRGLGVRPDPVRSFNRWKKKHSYRQSQKKQLRKQLKKPEWQVEREVISRLVQNYEKVSPEGGGCGLGPAGEQGMGGSGRGGGRRVAGARDLTGGSVRWAAGRCYLGPHEATGGLLGATVQASRQSRPLFCSPHCSW